jgi:uncharacterized protein YqeY
MDLRGQISQATTTAMKARDKARVGVLRLVNADIQRVEVDERKTLTDDEVIAVLNRMLKQRNDSESQYREAGRDDLADQEAYEIGVIKEFMPEALDEATLDSLIAAAVAEAGAESMKDMGKVMGLLKPQLAGRADMGQVSAKVKTRLN